MAWAATDFGFTGEQADANGLVYLRARYYDPALGVFPSLDPLEGRPSRAMSLNRYTYVAGNVVNRIDPSGAIREQPSTGCGNFQIDDQHPCRPNHTTQTSNGLYVEEWALRFLAIVVAREAPNHPEQWPLITHIFLNRAILTTQEFDQGRNNRATFNCRLYGDDISRAIACVVRGSSCLDSPISGSMACPTVDDTIFEGQLALTSNDETFEDSIINTRPSSFFCDFYDDFDLPSETKENALNIVRQAVGRYSDNSPYARYLYFRHVNSNFSISDMRTQACIQRAFYAVYKAYEAASEGEFSDQIVHCSQGLFVPYETGVTMKQYIDEAQEVAVDIYGTESSPVLVSNIGLSYIFPQNCNEHYSLTQPALVRYYSDAWARYNPYDYSSWDDCINQSITPL